MTSLAAGTALVVEDEPLVRIVAAEALHDIGIEVIEAPTGDAALALLREGLRPDLLVTDVKMPGQVDGLGLAREARRLQPGLAVVAVSGYAVYSGTDLTLDGAATFLPKPYSAAALQALARNLIRAAADDGRDH